MRLNRRKKIDSAESGMVPLVADLKWGSTVGQCLLRKHKTQLSGKYKAF